MNKLKIKKVMTYIIICIALLAYFFIRFPELKHSFSVGMTMPWDFPQDYIAGKQLLAGKSLYPSNFMEMYEHLLSKNNIPVARQIIYRNAHPPFTAILLFPLWFLSFHSAVFLWVFITIFCMFLIIYLLLKSENIPLEYSLLISLFVFAWPPFQTNLSVGQTSILITLFVVAGWFFLKRDKEILSGIFIALATMIKFYPGLLILYFLINRKYKAFSSAAVSIGIILIITFFLTRYDLFHFIFSVVPGDIRYWEADLRNNSFNGFFTKLFLSVHMYGNTGAITASLNRFHRNLFLYGTEAFFLFYGAFSTRKYNYNSALGFSSFIIASLLLSPLCWDHYLTLLLLPLIILMQELRKKKTVYEILFFITGLFLVSADTGSFYFKKALSVTQLFVHGNAFSILYRLTFFSAPFYGMLLLLLLNLIMLKRSILRIQENGN